MKTVTLLLGDGTNGYLVIDEATRKAVLIDPAADAARILAAAGKENATIEKILLTHCHFDHIGALNALQQALSCEVVCGEKEIAGLYDARVNLSEVFCDSPIVFDGRPKPASDGEVLSVGNLVITVLETPGHTVGSLSYLIENAVFCGDVIFSGSVGRTDFPGGNAAVLSETVELLLSHDEDIRLYPGHGPVTTVGKEKYTNPYYLERDF